MNIPQQLREIANALEGTGAVGGPVLQEDGSPEWDAEGRCVRDFWSHAMIGAQRGALRDHYVQAFTITQGPLGGGGRPWYTYVVIALPPSATWGAALRSAADVGWIDGSAYRHDANRPAHENWQEWVRHGCPLRNQYGIYDGSGAPVDAATAARWGGQS